MSCAYDLDDTGVELRTIDSGTTVRLWNRATPYDDDIVRVCVYLLELAEDFRGWAGVCTWESADHDLRIDAEHLSGGYVDLTWTITPWRGVQGRWSVSVKSTVQAGADMRRFAVNVDRLVRPG